MILSYSKIQVFYHFPCVFVMDMLQYSYTIISITKENFILNEDDLKLLISLEKYKTITKTADKLHISQPALTRKLKSLEAELDTQLFIRSRNGVMLTPIAEEILPQILSLSKNFDTIHTYFQTHSDHICGKIKVGFSINYAQYCMASAIADFVKKYPRVQLEIETNQSQNIFRRLSEHQLSLAVVRGKFPWDSGEILFNCESVYLIAQHDIKIKELNELPFLQRDSESGFSESLKKWFRENKIFPNHQVYIDNITATISLVEQGVGWAVVPEACLKHFHGFQQPIIFQDKTAFTRDSYLLFREEYIQLPQVRCFCESILESGNIPNALKRFQENGTRSSFRI